MSYTDKSLPFVRSHLIVTLKRIVLLKRGRMCPECKQPEIWS